MRTADNLIILVMRDRLLLVSAARTIQPLAAVPDSSWLVFSAGLA
jgi:hypothetical protein